MVLNGVAESFWFNSLTEYAGKQQNDLDRISLIVLLILLLKQQEYKHSR